MRPPKTLLLGCLLATAGVVPALAPAQVLQAERPSSRIEQLVRTLKDRDPARVAAAQDELVREGATAIPRLVSRYRELAAGVEVGDIPGLIALLDTLARLAPDHRELWPFLIEAQDAKTGPSWQRARVQDAEGTQLAWSRLQEAASRTLGATGPRHLAELASRAAQTADRAVYSFRPLDADLPAVFALLRDADTRSARWIAYAASTAREAGARALLDEFGSGDEARMRAALQAARAFAPERELLVPAIRPFLDYADPSLRYWACFALGSMVPDSLPVVFEACEHTDPRIRLCAVEIIEKTIWATWLDRESPDFAAYAGWPGLSPAYDLRRDSQALIEQQGVPLLAARLADTDEEVRVLAALALARLGAQAASAREALQSARVDTSPFVRHWVEHALTGMEPSRPHERLRLLAEALLSGPPAYVEGARIEELARDLDHPDEWPPVTEPYWFTWSDSRDHRWEAVLLLARQALPQLLELESRGGNDGEKATQILSKMDRELDARVSKLLRIVDDGISGGDRVDAELAALGSLVLPELARELLRNAREPTYAELLWVLEQLGDAALPVLTEGLEHWNMWGTAWSAQALFKLREQALPALPAVISAWRCAGDDVRLPGLSMLWDVRNNLGGSGPTHHSRERTFGRTDPAGVGGMGPGAVPWLTRVLGDEHALVRERASRALGSIGEPARDALVALSKLLDDSEEGVREAAARAILDLGGEDDALRARAQSLLDRR